MASHYELFKSKVISITKALDSSTVNKDLTPISIPVIDESEFFQHLERYVNTYKNVDGRPPLRIQLLDDQVPSNTTVH